MLGSVTLNKRKPLNFLLTANEAQLVDLSCKENLKGKFSDSSVCIFWLNAATVYSEHSDIALSMFLPFSTT